jgi:hypothetical protein
MPPNQILSAIPDSEFIAAASNHTINSYAKLTSVPPRTISDRARRLQVRFLPRQNKLKDVDTATIKKNIELIGVTNTAKALNVAPPSLHKRLSSRGVKAVSPYLNNQGRDMDKSAAQSAARIHIKAKDGHVIVFSDAHYWPGDPTTAHRALVHFTRKLQPIAVICNGDAVDMAAASRHPPIGWEKQPTVQQEIEAAQDRLHEVMEAGAMDTKYIWNLGNHDARFETRLASVAPEYALVAGIHLHDHFPLWDRAWSTWINDEVVIKHRFKGGLHAPWNNTMNAGKTMVTGHLHSAKVHPFTDYNGTRFGVDTGCLADPFGKQFTNYTEDNPRNWVSAFGVLTFNDGKLLWPELVVVWDKDTVQFRGELIRV